MEVIKAKNLTKILPNGKIVLDNLDFTIEESEIFCFFGPDGSGKSTLLRILAGLDRDYRGEVEVLGLLPWDRRLINKVGYLADVTNLYPDLTVKESVDFFSHLYGVSDEKFKNEILERFGLKNHTKKRISELSGGMKRKMGILLELIKRPSILILDEPTTGIDPLSRREVWDVITELKGKGLTFIVSTSYLEETMRCDEVYYLYVED